MARTASSYHAQISAANRASILDSATELFFTSGYDRTSLSTVAANAGVSKATLFKQFPTKAELFEAAMLAAGGSPDDAPVTVPTGSFESGLAELGRAYADILTRPIMVALMRTVIAESPRLPDLRARTFNFGTLPVLDALSRFLHAQNDTGRARVDDPETASAQFLGMIASAIFWPRLVHGTWSITAAEQLRAVDEAARTIAARYGRPD